MASRANDSNPRPRPSSKQLACRIRHGAPTCRWRFGGAVPENGKWEAVKMAQLKEGQEINALKNRKGQKAKGIRLEVSGVDIKNGMVVLEEPDGTEWTFNRGDLEELAAMFKGSVKVTFQN